MTSSFFKVPRIRLFSRSSLPLRPLPFLVLHPCRCNHPISPVSFLFLSTVSQQLLAVLPFSMTTGTYPPTLEQRLPLPSSKEGNESETVRHCRLSALAVPLLLQLFFRLSLSPPPYPLSLYTRYVSLHLSLSFSCHPFFSFSHPSVTLASPISLSSLHARASFPSYRRAAAILLPPF